MTTKKLIVLRLHELMLVLRLYIGRIYSFFYQDRELWLISERGKEARDNGYFFFVWLKKNHPEINAKYIISKDSKDIYKFESWKECIVTYNSLKHLSSIWKAKYLISTHICGYTNDHQFFSKFDGQFHVFKGKKIFLQHGITKDDLQNLYYGKINLDLFISGSKIEYDYIVKKFGYPDGIIKYTGLCRFDNLMDLREKKQILVMPTFRIYVDREHFDDSEYFKAYKQLLCSEILHQLLERTGYTLIFYPHYEFQSKIDSFKNLNLSDRISFADMSYDVQQLLKESEILITDYSSVFFDVMYMNKPVLFYQFDEEKYRAGHYKKGYLDYHNVGPVSATLDDLLHNLNLLLIEKRVDKKYQEYYEKTYIFRDCNNCKRVYQAILQC